MLPVAGIAIFCASIIWLVTTALKNSAPYQTGVQRAEQNAQVVYVLGSPVTETWWLKGHVSDNGRSGSAYLAIPIEGPKGKGTLYVDAYKSRGTWIYSLVKVRIDGTHDEIILN